MVAGVMVFTFGMENVPALPWPWATRIPCFIMCVFGVRSACGVHMHVVGCAATGASLLSVSGSNYNTTAMDAGGVAEYFGSLQVFKSLSST